MLTNQFLARTSFSAYTLDGRDRSIVLAEWLVRVIAAIRFTSVRWWSYLTPNTEIGLIDPAFIALRYESRDGCSFV